VIRLTIVFFLLFGEIHEPPVITWNELYQLSWKDFKGKPFTNSSAVAVTASGISFEYSIKQSLFGVINYKTKVLACFYPEESWYKLQLVNGDVLAHEQLHYNITELYARKFRKALASIKSSKSLKLDLNKLQKAINSQLTKRQNDYDFETNHSRIPQAQKQWQLRIEKELLALEAFKSN